MKMLFVSACFSPIGQRSYILLSRNDATMLSGSQEKAARVRKVAGPRESGKWTASQESSRPGRVRKVTRESGKRGASQESAALARVSKAGPGAGRGGASPKAVFLLGFTFLRFWGLGGVRVPPRGGAGWGGGVNIFKSSKRKNEHIQSFD